jgi:plasmid stabilization system protein ParE
MDFQVTFSKSAVAELEEILASILYEDPRAGRQYYEKLRGKALSLATFPKRHPLTPCRTGVRKFTVWPYTVYYRVNEAKRRVTILHFWHGARRPPFL